MSLKERIKNTPVIGRLAIILNRLIKKVIRRQALATTKIELDPIYRDYSQMSVQERQADLDRRYSKGSLYEATTLWDTVRYNEIDYFTKKAMNSCEGKEILDLGCATRGGVLMVSGCGKYIGTDLPETAVKAARENYGHLENVVFKRMDAAQIEYENGSFDVVLARELIEHLPDIDVCLREVFRVLRNGGKFILTSPNTDSLHLHVARFAGQKEFVCSYDHINEISYKECCRKLKIAGFVIEEASGIFLMPYWGVENIDSQVRHLTDNNPDMVEMLRDLGEKSRT